MASIRAEPENLLARAMAGDTAARGDLLERYRNYLELLARIQIGRCLQAKVEAADLVQETFLAAHRDFAAFRGLTEPGHHLHLTPVLSHLAAPRLPLRQFPNQTSFSPYHASQAPSHAGTPAGFFVPDCPYTGCFRVYYDREPP